MLNKTILMISMITKKKNKIALFVNHLIANTTKLDLNLLELRCYKLLHICLSLRYWYKLRDLKLWRCKQILFLYVHSCRYLRVIETHLHSLKLLLRVDLLLRTKLLLLLKLFIFLKISKIAKRNIILTNILIRIYFIIYALRQIMFLHNIPRIF